MEAERFFTVTWPGESGKRYRAFRFGMATKRRKVEAIRALVNRAFAEGEPVTSRGLSVLKHDEAALVHANAWGWSGRGLTVDPEQGTWVTRGGFVRNAECIVVIE